MPENLDCKGVQVAFELRGIVDVSLVDVAQRPVLPALAPQSVAAMAKPRASKSPTTAKYFSMNSPPPPRRTIVPTGDDRIQRTVRSQTSSAAQIHSAIASGGTGFSGVETNAIGRKARWMGCFEAKGAMGQMGSFGLDPPN
jgi:hypothetical protein